MFWLVPALAAPLLWGGSNLVDEHLVNRAERDPFTLAIIAGIFASLPAIFVVVTGRWIWCGWETAIVALVGGAFGIVVYLPYLAALRIASPSVVMLMWNLSPVAIVAIAHFTVKERLHGSEYVAVGLLVAGSALASICSDRGRSVARAIRLMVLASLILAVSSVAEKATYDRLTFWAGFGWLSLGAATATFILTLASQRARCELQSAVRDRMLTLYIGNESLDLAAVYALNLATSLAPVSLVHAVGGTQPVFILLIEQFLPRRAGSTRAEWLRTAFAAALAVVGLGLLRSAT
jgi:drug/metabolite transporter (DMT)-like permease